MSESSGTVASYTIHAEFEGETHRFSCRADQSVLQAAEAAGVMLPSSCCSGCSPAPRLAGLRREWRPAME